MVVALAIPLLSGWLTKFMSLQAGYMTTTLIMAVIMVGIIFWAYTQIHERIQVVSHEDPPGIRDVFHQLTHNKPGVILFLLFLGVYGFNTVQSATGVYYMTYFAMRPDLVAWFSLMNVLPSVIGVPLVPLLARRIHKKPTVLLGLGIAGLGALLLVLVPNDNIAMMMVCRGISSFGYGILMGILWSIITDAVESGDLNTGRRLAAIIMTLIGLGLKFAMTIGGVIPTLVLGYVKYQPNVAQQTPEALAGIHWMSSWLPAIVMLMTFVTVGFFYDLNEEKVAAIQHKIAVRDGVIEPVDDEERAL